MSLSRMFFNDLRPLIRMLEEPFTNPAFIARPLRQQFFEPYLGSSNALRPALDLAEDAEGYRVEAELPGVKKEDIRVSIGDGGRSITIEGKVESRDTFKAVEGPGQGEGKETEIQKANEQEQQISSERSFVNQATFHRTVWLPRPVDSEKVKAKVENGILTLRIPKAKEDKSTVDVKVD